MTELRYQSFVPTEAGTITPADWCEVVNLIPAGGLTALTVNAPKQPADKQPLTVSSTQVVATMTLTAQSGSGQTIQKAAIALTAGGPAPRWVFNAPTNTWMVA